MLSGIRFLVLYLFFILCIANLSGLSNSDIQGGWYRLNASDSNQKNGFFRIDVYCFSPSEAGTFKTYSASIYPSSDIRTRITSGSLTVLVQGPTNINAIFRQKSTAVAYHLNEPKGWPLASILDMPGPTEIQKDATLNFQTGPQPETLIIDGKTYRSIVADLRLGARGSDTQENAITFLRLSYLMIYLFQARVPGFATGAMIGISSDINGLYTGALHMEFTPRGTLGLGNSGIQFTLKDSSDIPGILASGNIFAGVYSMEGVLNFYDEQGGNSFLGSIDFTKVQANHGIFIGGYLQVMLASGQSSKHVYQLPYNTIPD